MNNNEIIQTSNTENVTISRAEYEKLLAQAEELAEAKAANQWLLEQLNVIKRKNFGSSSEKASDEVYEQLSLLFDEAEMYDFLESKKEKLVKVNAYEKKVKTSNIMDSLPDNLPVEVNVHELPKSERICPVCNEVMTQIGTETVRSLKIIPAQVIIVEDVYPTYACKNCLPGTEGTEIIKAPHKKSCYPGSYASPEAVAYLMTEKYVMGSPLYRMEQNFERRGIPISRQTMSNWMIHCCEEWLVPVYEELHQRLLDADIIHADETEVKVIHEKGKDGAAKAWMWLFRTGKYEESQIVLYKHAPGRGKNNPAEFLEGFKGDYLQTDGYAGYNSVEAVHVGCLAHVKRKFHEAVENLPKHARRGAAVKGEAYCTALFDIEEKLADLTPEERYTERLRLEKPILDEFLSWAKTVAAAPKSKLGKAITYTCNQSQKLSNYLLDGRLEISNNIAERSIKPFVISRKNFLFSNTSRGADSSAVTFSIIETAKANGLDPYKYLTYILREAPALASSCDNWAEKLLPGVAPEECLALIRSDNN